MISGDTEIAARQAMVAVEVECYSKTSQQSQETESRPKCHCKRWPQYLAGVSASLGSFSIGLSVGYSSTAIPSMQVDKNFQISEDDAALVGSTLLLGVLAGNLLVGSLLAFLCHRTTILCICPLASAGWLLICFSNSIPLIVIGRGLTGLAKGLMQPAVQLYTSEISDRDIRGIISAFPNLFLSLGVLASYMLGAWLPWNQLSGLCSLFPILTFVCLLFVPSSPRNLISKSKVEKAAKAVAWLRSRDFKEGQIAITSSNKINKKKEKCSSGFGALLEIRNVKPLLLCAGLLVLQRLSGVYNVIMYTESIFQKVGGSVTSSVGTILVGVMKLLGHLLVTFMADRVGRKPLLKLSTFMMAASLLPLGGYYYITESNGNVDMFGWVPVVTLMSFMFFFSVGFGTIPFIFLGEVLPSTIRAKGSTICYSLHALVTYLHSRVFFSMEGVLHSYGVFFLYSGISLFSCTYVFLFLPETKGKSLEELEKKFEQKHSEIDTSKMSEKLKEVLCCGNSRGSNTKV